MLYDAETKSGKFDAENRLKLEKRSWVMPRSARAIWMRPPFNSHYIAHHFFDNAVLIQSSHG
jgi:hypothetical protein